MRELLPQLAVQASVRGETRLRIWSAGCASGEEPYTLALMFALGETPKSGESGILATDADPSNSQCVAEIGNAECHGGQEKEISNRVLPEELQGEEVIAYRAGCG